MSNGEGMNNNFSIMCRLCLSENVDLVNIYTDDQCHRMNSSNKIVEIIERFTTIKIRSTDNLPRKICLNCSETVKSMLAFQNQCKRNDKKLQKLLDKTSAAGDVENTNGFENVVVKSEFIEECGKSIDIESFNETEVKKESDNLVEPLDMLEINVNDVESDDETVDDEVPPSKFSSSSSDNPRHKPTKSSPTVACHICGKLFIKYRLQFHLNEHNGLRLYKCDAKGCTSTFTAPYHLNSHKRSTHRSPKWKCDVCDKAFKRSQAMQVHRLTHSDPDIPCKICRKLFKTPKYLFQHMLVHTQERKFKCDSCSKSFLRSYTLRIHQRIHTQEKPYSCHCGVSFAYNCLLKAHKQKHHNESEEA